MKLLTASYVSTRIKYLLILISSIRLKVTCMCDTVTTFRCCEECALIRLRAFRKRLYFEFNHIVRLRDYYCEKDSIYFMVRVDCNSKKEQSQPLTRFQKKTSKYIQIKHEINSIIMITDNQITNQPT